MFRILRLVLVDLVLISAVVSAQDDFLDPAALFGDEAVVRVVNVEAFVTLDGRPVTDLSKDDFRLYEDGEPMEITYFSRVGTPGGETPDAEAEVPAAPEPHSFEPKGRFVVYVDSLFLGPARRDRFFSDLFQTLERDLRSEDEVMVVTYDGNLKIRTPFTADRDAVRRALREASALEGIQLSAGLEERRDLQTIVDFQSLGNEDACLGVGAIAQQQADRMEHRVVASAQALNAFVNSLGGIPGRKTILHVSAGIPLLAGGTGWRYAVELCDGSGAIRDVPHSMDARVEDAQFDKWDASHYRTAMFDHDTSRHWIRLAAHANAHNVAIYAVEATGPQSISLPDDIRASRDVASFARSNRQDPLVLMSEKTGGRAILDASSFQAPIAAVIQDSRFYYLLGFEPRGVEPGSRHDLRLEVDRPGVRVRHRQSYRAKSLDENVADGVLTTLLHSRSENPLGAEVSFEPIDLGSARASDRGTMRVRVPFEALALLPRDGARHGMITVFLATRNLQSGRMTPIRQASLPLRIPEEGAEEAFVYEVEMPLGPHTEIALALRDDFGGTTSYLRETVDLRRR